MAYERGTLFYFLLSHLSLIGDNIGGSSSSSGGGGGSFNKASSVSFRIRRRDRRRAQEHIDLIYLSLSSHFISDRLPDLVHCSSSSSSTVPAGPRSTGRHIRRRPPPPPLSEGPQPQEKESQYRLVVVVVVDGDGAP